MFSHINLRPLDNILHHINLLPIWLNLLQLNQFLQVLNLLHYLQGQLKKSLYVEKHLRFPLLLSISKIFHNFILKHSIMFYMQFYQKISNLFSKLKTQIITLKKKNKLFLFILFIDFSLLKKKYSSCQDLQKIDFIIFLKHIEYVILRSHLSKIK